MNNLNNFNSEKLFEAIGLISHDNIAEAEKPLKERRTKPLISMQFAGVAAAVVLLVVGTFAMFHFLAPVDISFTESGGNTAKTVQHESSQIGDSLREQISVEAINARFGDLLIPGVLELGGTSVQHGYTSQIFRYTTKHGYTTDLYLELYKTDHAMTQIIGVGVFDKLNIDDRSRLENAMQIADAVIEFLMELDNNYDEAVRELHDSGFSALSESHKYTRESIEYHELKSVSMLNIWDWIPDGGQIENEDYFTVGVRVENFTPRFRYGSYHNSERTIGVMRQSDGNFAVHSLYEHILTVNDDYVEGLGIPEILEIGNTPGNMVNQGLVAMNGEKIYFIDSIHAGIYSMDLDGSNRRRLFDADEDYALNGINVINDRVFFINNGINSISTDGTDLMQLSDDYNIYSLYVVDDNLYYTIQKGYSNYIYTMKADGSGNKRLGDIGMLREYLFVAEDRIFWANGSMRLDGSDVQIYSEINGWFNALNVINGRLICHRTDDVEEGKFLYSMNIDGSDRVRISDIPMGANPWGINVTDNSIYFTTGDNNAFHVMNLDGSNPRKLNDGFTGNIYVGADVIVYYFAPGLNQLLTKHIMDIGGSNNRRF
jgi:hypothetical protein